MLLSSTSRDIQDENGMKHPDPVRRFLMETITLARTEAEPTIEEEASLVEAARHDTAAFSRLYRRYVTPVYRYLYKWVGNPAEAEDLTSQVFTEALEGLARYRERGNFAAWLFTIARRRLVDFYRQRPCASLGDPPSPEPGQLAAVEKGEDLQRLAYFLLTVMRCKKQAK